MNKRPNILLIMADQHRGDCLGLEGHPVLLTPNMDEIGRRGAHFSSCYSTCPVCIPARRSLLSGQFPSTHGFFSNVEGVEWDGATLPAVLRQAGYETFLAGRDMHQYPKRKRYGFDHMVTNLDYRDEMRIQYPQVPLGDNQYSGLLQSTGVMHNDWTARTWPYDESAHHTNWAVSQALRFLRRRDPSCPFFLVVSFTAPHPPLIPPAFYFDRYLRQPVVEPVIGDWAMPGEQIGGGVSAAHVNLTGEALRSCRAAYYGLINHIDDQIRRLLNPVEGIATDRDDTVVLYTADHGEMLGDHYLFRKSLPYEASARIPLLLDIPARFGFDRRVTIDKPVGLEDIMPTLLELAGADLPGSVDGKSLLPLLRGDTTGWREYQHVECSNGDLSFQALTDGKEKYIWFTGDGREQFFDLAADPDERKNLVGHPGAEERIPLWRERLVATLANRNEGFVENGCLVAGRPYLRQRAGS